MKYLLTILSTLLIISACDNHCPPVVDDPIDDDSSTAPTPQACYDSTYFDTTLQMEEHDLVFFTVDLPKGSFSYTDKRGIENDPGGSFGFGCDTFDFAYGPRNVNAYDYTATKYTTDLRKFKRDDYLIAVDHSLIPETELKVISILISRNDTQNINMGIVDPHYDYYVDKVIETIELR